MELNIYSKIFTTLYDQTKPVENIGRGTHYSILRSIETENIYREHIDKAVDHDFCVVWDEDHDKRIIDFITMLYVRKLLSPIVFIGERKGCVTVVCHSKFLDGNKETIADFKYQIDDIANSLIDPWATDYDTYTIINDTKIRVSTYLNSINELWKLEK